MNIETLKETIPFLFKANIATMIVGHHGIGKSQAVAQYAKENGYEFVDLRLGTMDVGDLLGLADFEKDLKTGQNVATRFMRPEWFPTDPKSKGIIFMDEINRARRDVLQAVFQLVLDKKLHRYTLPEGWQVIAAMNPSTSDYIVTDISDKAFMDRFCHIKLAPSKPEFFKYAKSIGVEPQIISFLENQPKLIQSALEEFSLDVTPSRRSWMAVDRVLKLKPSVYVLREIAQGLVGAEAATALMKSLSETDKPITSADVLTNFTKFKKKIAEYSDAKTGGRIDMLKFTCDSILEFATATKKPIGKAESENLGNFLNAIPKDLAYNLCRELYMEDSTRHVIDENQELLNDIAAKRNIKV